MASPQAENGHIDIANEIAEKLARYRISGQENQVLWVVFRKTYGWHKKDDEISLSQFCKFTDMKRSQVVRSLKKLVSKRILTSTQKGTTFANKYRFNKDYETWLPSIKRDTLVSKRILEGVSKRIPKVVSKRIHTKETSKETNTKEKNVEQSSTTPVKKQIKDRYQDTSPMTCIEFVEYCRVSNARHIQIIGEWAEGENPEYKTKGEWLRFINRNLRPAKELIPFTNEQLQEAYKKMLKDIERINPTTGKKQGFITKYTLETLNKYI